MQGICLEGTPLQLVGHCSFANLFLCPKEERVLECNARLRNFKLYSVG